MLYFGFNATQNKIQKITERLATQINYLNNYELAWN